MKFNHTSIKVYLQYIYFRAQCGPCVKHFIGANGDLIGISNKVFTPTNSIAFNAEQCHSMTSSNGC